MGYNHTTCQYVSTDKNLLIFCKSRSPWPRVLRLRPAAPRLLRSWVRIPPGAWKFVCCVCCVLSGRGLCDELIARPEESSRLWCVVVCDLETSRMRRPWHALGRSATKKNIFCKSMTYLSIGLLMICQGILSPIKLCIGGLWQITVPQAKY